MSTALASEWRSAREATYQLRPSSCTLSEFIRRGWHEVEPAMPFMPNWHIDAISEHLEAASRGQITKLVISIAPGHAKSIIVAVMWPAWVWTWNPHWRSIFASHDMTLSMRDSVRARALMESDWYRKEFAPQWKFTVDQNVKSYYRNTNKGERIALSVGGGTGFRGNAVVVDDPVKVADRFSETAMATAIDWWDKTMSSRFNDQSKGVRVIIAQRTVVNDLTGHVLAAGGYQHLCLPSEYDPKRRAITSLGIADKRSKPGELLFPTLFPQAVLDQAKKDLGSIDYSAQHQQLPVPMSGGIFQREWFEKNFYTTLPVVFQEIIDSWDMSFKDTKSADYVVGQRWGRVGADLYLLRERRGQMNYPTTRKEVKEFSRAPTIGYGSSVQHPPANLKLVEDKANGPAIIADLRAEIPGLVAVEPDGSKEARAAAVSPMCEAGNVHLPDPAIWPEVNEWLDEICTFPKGIHDDRVDTFTQALRRLKSHILGTPLEQPKGQLTEAAAVTQERF